MAKRIVKNIVKGGKDTKAVAAGEDIFLNAASNDTPTATPTDEEIEVINQLEDVEGGEYLAAGGSVVRYHLAAAPLQEIANIISPTIKSAADKQQFESIVRGLMEEIQKPEPTVKEAKGLLNGLGEFVKMAILVVSNAEHLKGLYDYLRQIILGN